MRALTVLVAILVLGNVGLHAEEMRNWFDDPFFQITSSVQHCPEPAGPRVTKAERQAQSHRRAEKGTTCWLAKEEDCQRHNAYSYDREIAGEIQAAVRASSAFPETSLWVTVQGRIVYIEGCVSHESQARSIETFIRGMPHVQQVIAIVTPNPNERPPYRLLPSR